MEALESCMTGLDMEVKMDITIIVICGRDQVGTQTMNTAAYDELMDTGVFEFIPILDGQRRYTLGRFNLTKVLRQESVENQIRFFVSDFEVQESTESEWISYSQVRFDYRNMTVR